MFLTTQVIVIRRYSLVMTVHVQGRRNRSGQSGHGLTIFANTFKKFHHEIQQTKPYVLPCENIDRYSLIEQSGCITPYTLSSLKYKTHLLLNSLVFDNQSSKCCCKVFNM